MSQNLKPMITEEEVTEAAKTAYESHKEILYSKFEDCFDADFPSELEPLAYLMYCTGYADAICDTVKNEGENENEEVCRIN